MVEQVQILSPKTSAKISLILAFVSISDIIQWLQIIAIVLSIIAALYSIIIKHKQLKKDERTNSTDSKSDS